MATLSKLELEDTSRTLFVLSEYQDNSISVQVSDGMRAWEGSLSSVELATLAERAKVTLDSFIRDTLKALSRQDLGDRSFLYSANHLDNNKMQLVWKRHIVSDNIKFQLGEVDLCAGTCTAIVSALLNFAIDSIGELQHGMGQLGTKCARLTREREEALRELEKHADLQEKVEKDLFGKFKVVLNEKKAKIRNLMESKKHLTEQNEELRQKLWTRSNSSPALADDTSSQEECQQDKSVILPVVPECSSTPGPTNSRSGGGSGGVTSLLGDVQCRAPSPPPARKQRRTTEPQKSLADLSRPLATNISHSARKSNIVIAKQVNKELDSDELLDML